MMIALLQEMLLALRDNNAEDFKEWLVLGLDEPGRKVTRATGGIHKE